jgi:catechol 2,3-dioxygenase-like lactoylglutathione lyase family enzyme
MRIELDHLILRVKDTDASVAFYTKVLGLGYEGRREPFAVLRVTDGLTIQLAASATAGGEHLAFAMDPAEFDAAFERIRAAGIRYGDSFQTVGNMKGPGREPGARGEGRALYLFDPSRHLIEIRSYERP